MIRGNKDVFEAPHRSVRHVSNWQREMIICVHIGILLVHELYLANYNTYGNVGKS